MTISYGSPAYCLYLFVSAAVVILIYRLFRYRSERAKGAVLFILAGLNLFQHLFKFIVWPHLYGTGFNLRNTAYNVCAYMIMITPFVLASKNMLWRQFTTYIGTAGGALALIVPQWFIGQTIFRWEFLRFWTCHTLLLATSILPPLWNQTRFYARDGWKTAALFFLMLFVILADNVVFICGGFYKGGNKDTLYESLLVLNPLWMMRPPELFPWLKRVIELLTFPFFLGNGERPYTPILWYFLPMFLLISAGGTAVGAVYQYVSKNKRSKKCNFCRRINS